MRKFKIYLEHIQKVGSRYSNPDDIKTSQIISITCQHFGINPEQIKEINNHDTNVLYARRIIAYLLHTQTHKKRQQIGELLGVTREQTYHQFNKIKDHLDYYRTMTRPQPDKQSEMLLRIFEEFKLFCITSDLSFKEI